MKARITLSNKAMLAAALLTLPADIVAVVVIVTSNAHPAASGGPYIDIGDVSLLARTNTILGSLASAVVFGALLLGLNHEPKNKTNGIVACIMVLAITLFQVIAFR